MTIDWDAAFDNFGSIKDAATYPPRWQAEAAAFRNARSVAGRAELDITYGSSERERYDLFFPDATDRPDGNTSGLTFFIHGGFWKAFDKSTWSHLAKGPLSRGQVVCMPSYPLAPEARISEITTCIAAAVENAAGRVSGPIHLAGHSAGGHLVTRMMSTDTQLSSDIISRIASVVSISGVHDLRPLLKTSMNSILQLTAEEATRESSVLNMPLDVPLTCWVGADELPQFIHQNDTLADVWSIDGRKVRSEHVPDKHHFSVIEDLVASDSALADAVVTRIA